MPEVSVLEWDNFIAHHPDAHLLQTGAWGELKSAFGWHVIRLLEGVSGAQILFRKLLPGVKIGYIPRGPIGEDSTGLWQQIDAACHRQGAIFLKIEPDRWAWRESNPDSSEISLPPQGFTSSTHSIQPPRTLVIDLTRDEQSVLGQMKQKTRYNIHLAQKKGVVVRPSSDISLFYQLMQVTGERDQVSVHNQSYYQKAYELFHSKAACELLCAESEGEAIAALMVFAQGGRAWYFYGASSNQHRDRMPNYLLQWEAMRWARSRGCKEYDLWGVPDADPETLEAEFTQHSDGLWGVYRFKRGFGGELRRAAGPWDRVYHPLLYRLYRVWLKARKTNE